MMVTWPAIDHWFGIFSVTDLLRELLDTFCCASLIDLFRDTLGRPDNTAASGNANPAEAGLVTESANLSASNTETTATADNIGAAMRPGPTSVSSLLSQASAELANGVNFSSLFSRGTGTGTDNFSKLLQGFAERGAEPLQIGAVLNGISPKFKLPTDGQSLSPAEIDNIPLVLMAEIVAKPVMKTIIGEQETERQLTEVLNRLQGQSPDYSAELLKKELLRKENLKEEDMLKQLDQMQAVIEQQNQQIKQFKNTLSKTAKKK
ncbi:MAG: hypothetical protein AAFZ92_10950 [Pseudomonadota bacterium]